MRVLILLRDLSLNGITSYNRILAGELRAQGHTVFVLPSGADMPSDNRFGWPLLHPCLEPLVRGAIARLMPDVIVVNHYTQARVAHRLSESLGIPWLAIMHNAHSDRRMREWAQLFSNVSGVVTMCQTLRDKYSDLLRESAGFLAGHKPPIFLSRLPLQRPVAPLARSGGATPETVVRLAYCSRLSGSKGPRCEAWLKAVALLPDHASYRLRVMGGGSQLRQIKQLAGRLGLNVEFTGMVANVLPYLEDVSVMTGAGYAVLEGLVHGCAAVGLGFGGCFGAVTAARLDAAMAVNFGDHAMGRFSTDPAFIAQELQTAIELHRSGQAQAVSERVIALCAPAEIATGLTRFAQRVCQPAYERSLSMAGKSLT
ncbi:glycosyltransferase [Roseateles koreensis]|uniref:Glycosyltransferase n=1 Tax=Roseateles koreensis TaxID=2987526 RepID=A0ABT5KNR6_9BURK|nr:glycosyltransferase [Roseateles koreensis]MDC8784486.1 glycosyltransferase [Roseateles koreensis]